MLRPGGNPGVFCIFTIYKTMYIDAVTVENTISSNGSGPKGRGFESRHFDRKPSENQGSGGFRYVPLNSVIVFYNVQYMLHHNELYIVATWHQ